MTTKTKTTSNSPITPLRVAQAALRYWSRLGCNNGQTECRYSYPDGSRCIIGNAMTVRQLAAIDRAYAMNSNIWDTNVENILGVEKWSAEWKILDELQALHDIACQEHHAPADIAALRARCEEIVAESGKP